MQGPAADARRRHYAGFYEGPVAADDARPLLVVHGNCQAEALRVVLEASTDELLAVRVPPVHELTAEDLGPLRRLLRRTSVLVAQPVRDDWRGLPVGTRQVAAAAPGARLVRIPVVRHTGLHPWTALVRTPWMGDPPLVPYHDLRTILHVHRGGERPAGHGRAAGYRAVHDASLRELRRREDEHGTLRASDLVAAAGAGAAHTANHPGNAVLVPLAGRILAACGVPDAARDPGRTLLRSVRAPLPADVLDALGADPGAAREGWDVGGRLIGEDEVAAAQHGFYADRRPVVDAALHRYAPAIEALGL